MQSDGARGLLDTSSSKGRKETAEAWAPAKIESEIEKMAFNSRSQGTLRKLSRQGCIRSLHHVEPRPRTRSSRRVTAVSNRVGANQQRSRSTGASFRWQAKCDRCLDLVINSRSQALVPLIPAPIQRKTQPALVSTLGETSSIITLAHIHRSPGDRLGKNSQRDPWDLHDFLDRKDFLSNKWSNSNKELTISRPKKLE